MNWLKKFVKLMVKLMLKPIARGVVAILAHLARWSEGKPWMPIFYFFLPDQNTNSVQYLHILHNVQMKTGRRVIVVSPWPFWPKSTRKDPSFFSFIQGLTPKIRYVWVPMWFQNVIHYFTTRLLWCAGRESAWLRPRDLHSAIRYHGLSTVDHTDILNYGSRVVFHIPKSHEHILERKLIDLGISPYDWFVCVHAREHGWHKDVAKTKYDPDYSFKQEDQRNVDIRDYFQTIDYIRSKGGMIVRLGDPSMKRIGNVDGFIDYPFTDHWSLPMDLFLMSRCRFYIGGCSGVSSSSPVAFGKPTLITNFPGPVFTIRWPYSNTLFLTKHVVEKKTGRMLGMPEMFEGMRGIMNDAIKFESLGLIWQSNKPEDILGATKEMLCLIENNSFDQTRTKEQELFHQLRLQAIDYLCSTLDGSGKFRFSNGRSSQSRISATFAVRYFAEEGAREKPTVATPS